MNTNHCHGPDSNPRVNFSKRYPLPPPGLEPTSSTRVAKLRISKHQKARTLPVV